MTKAEMETHRAEYHSLVAKARLERDKGRYREAMDFATASWAFIDGMMRYERKYENREFASIEGIEIVLNHAPFLFDVQVLDKLENLLRTQRRIERNTSDNLVEKLTEARKLMLDAHRLWNHLEGQSERMQADLRRTLGGDQDRWRWIVEVWATAGIVHRTPDGGSYRLRFSTQLDEKTPAKCPSCAARVRAPKSKLLQCTICPKCRTEVLFVLLLPEPS